VAALDAGTLPEGLGTTAGERGTALSGGRLQRLAIARAVVARPRVLVLDEALGRLDAAAAGTVRERLTRLRVPPIIIEITHRADMIADETPAAVVDRGRGVERGTARGLRARGTAFARLELRSDRGFR